MLTTLEPDKAASRTELPVVGGRRITYSQIPAKVAPGSNDSIFAGFYAPGEDFGWIDLDFTTAEGGVRAIRARSRSPSLALLALRRRPRRRPQSGSSRSRRSPRTRSPSSASGRSAIGQTLGGHDRFARG